MPHQSLTTAVVQLQKHRIVLRCIEEHHEEETSMKSFSQNSLKWFIHHWMHVEVGCNYSKLTAYSNEQERIIFFDVSKIVRTKLSMMHKGWVEKRSVCYFSLPLDILNPSKRNQKHFSRAAITSANYSPQAWELFSRFFLKLILSYQIANVIVWTYKRIP